MEHPHERSEADTGEAYPLKNDVGASGPALSTLGQFFRHQLYVQINPGFSLTPSRASCIMELARNALTTKEGTHMAIPSIQVSPDDVGVLARLALTPELTHEDQEYLKAIATACQHACSRVGLDTDYGFKYEHIGGPDGESDFEGVTSKVRL
jgi:hypothetical protein